MKNKMEAIKYPISTEKAIRMMESDNVITFIVDSSAKKEDIKKEMESMFKVKVVSVRTTNVFGKKKAFVKLSKEHPAIDIATQLGMM